MLCAVLEKVDRPKIKRVPGLVLSRAGHLQTPLVRYPALASRVVLGREAVPAVGPVALVVSDCGHVGHLGD